MNGKKSKLIRKQAEKFQVQWINSLLTEDADKVTHQTLNQALPDQKYYYKGYTLCLSFMNHKWVEKRIKKNPNITLDELIKVNG
jgi:hypothetical protein|tara:strand:- start:377 stop:628 length:252 start_codon:yes stop_codon:yes gene_type:complete